MSCVSVPAFVDLQNMLYASGGVFSFGPVGVLGIVFSAEKPNFAIS